MQITLDGRGLFLMACTTELGKKFFQKLLRVKLDFYFIELNILAYSSLCFCVFILL